MADCNAPTQVCVLKVELPCCEAFPGKVNKKLLKIQGVQGIHTDTEEGVVIVTGLLDPAIITQTIGKLGVGAELLAYEKDSKRAKKKLDHFLKGHSKDNKRNLEENNDRDHDRGWYEYDAGCVMPSCTSRRHPNYGRRRVRPGFPRPNYVHPINQPVIYNRPPPPPPRYVRWTRPPLPYPFSIYEQQEQDVGNAPHHILSDENQKVGEISESSGVEMDTEAELPKRSTARHKCASCYKQFKRKDHLIEHMKISYHSVHQPKCAVCQKLFKSFESLREHLTGPLSKAHCSGIFSDRGCNLCMNIFDCPSSLSKHKEACFLSAPVPFEKTPCNAESQKKISGLVDEKCTCRGPKAVAMDCEMVGGGSNGTLDLCARVCLVDEDENVIFHTYVQPQLPVTNYRYEVTGLTEEHIKDAMPLKEVKDKILEILNNGESTRRLMLDGGKARLLVGHGLEHDLDSLRMNYPDHMLRDTAKYRPLMKTNLVSHSLKYLTKTYLGYDIQSGVHDPYEDCVSVMRLYKRFRCQNHQVEEIGNQNNAGSFDSYKYKELEKMSPTELYEISKSDYRCWCLD